MSTHHPDSVIGQSGRGSKGKKEDTYSYKGWLISDSFFKRMLAILGYQTVATLFIYGVLIGIIIVFSLLGFIFGLIF